MRPGRRCSPARGQVRLAPSGHVIGIDMDAALRMAEARGHDLGILSELLPAGEVGPGRGAVLRCSPAQGEMRRHRRRPLTRPIALIRRVAALPPVTRSRHSGSPAFRRPSRK